MNGICKDLVNNPELIKRQKIRFLGKHDHLYEADSLEICRALTECELKQDDLLEKAGVQKGKLIAFYKLIKTGSEDIQRNSFDGFRECGTTEGFVKSLGIALKDNENAFIHDVDEETDEDFRVLINAVMRTKEYSNDIVKAVYHDVITICNRLAKSRYFHCLDDGQYADLFYVELIDGIRSQIGANVNSDTADALYRILDEMQDMVMSFDLPNVCDRWINANPKIKFYDCVFDIRREAPEQYEMIANSTGFVHFRFIPTAEEIRAEVKYKEEMSKLRQQNGETEDEQYQREVITAVKNIFKQDLDFEED